MSCLYRSLSYLFLVLNSGADMWPLRMLQYCRLLTMYNYTNVQHVQHVELIAGVVNVDKVEVYCRQVQSI